MTRVRDGATSSKRTSPACRAPLRPSQMIRRGCVVDVISASQRSWYPAMLSSQSNQVGVMSFTWLTLSILEGNSAYSCQLAKAASMGASTMTDSLSADENCNVFSLEQPTSRYRQHIVCQPFYSCVWGCCFQSWDPVELPFAFCANGKVRGGRGCRSVEREHANAPVAGLDRAYGARDLVVFEFSRMSRSMAWANH